MRKYPKILIAVAATAGAIFAFSSAAASAQPIASGRAGRASVAVTSHVAGITASASCAKFTACDYNGTGYSGAELVIHPGTMTWSSTYANKDQSINNGTSGYYLRLYYAAGLGGAHVCLKPGAQYSNLYTAGIIFNDDPGQAGYGELIWKNVHSDSLDTTPCS